MYCATSHGNRRTDVVRITARFPGSGANLSSSVETGVCCSEVNLAPGRHTGRHQQLAIRSADRSRTTLRPQRLGRVVPYVAVVPLNMTGVMAASREVDVALIPVVCPILRLDTNGRVYRAVALHVVSVYANQGGYRRT